MTKEQALSFDRYSERNAEILRGICPACKPYQDWFTYKRWLAQDKQVAKGQHGTRITVIVDVDNKDDDEQPVHHAGIWKAVVFCRHQLKK